MPHIDEQLIAAAARGEMDALAQLDARGLTPAVGEDAEAFAARLNELNRNIAAMDEALARDGKYTVEDVTVEHSERIPEEIFATPSARTDALYGFCCDWVPGFFLNPRFSGLFGGCAYYFFPDFFALFIIRHSFKEKKRWLCYDRDELLAHELCHVARVGVMSQRYEELFAYQTAHSGFRRLFGGIFLSQRDVFMFLFAALFQFAYQLVRSLFFYRIPVWLGWAVMFAVVAFLVLRLCGMLHTVKRAHNALLGFFAGDERAARAALFHASDCEVNELAKTHDVSTLLHDYASKELRWRIVLHRFSHKEE